MNATFNLISTKCKYIRLKSFFYLKSKINTTFLNSLTKSHKNEIILKRFKIQIYFNVISIIKFTSIKVIFDRKWYRRPINFQSKPNFDTIFLRFTFKNHSI